jgi:hypothetical protein
MLSCFRSISKALLLFSFIQYSSYIQTINFKGLIVSETEKNTIQTNIKTYPWCGQYKDKLLKTADSIVLETIALPSRGSNWNSWYVSPITGGKLVTGKKIGFEKWQHLDEKGHVFFGNDSTGKTDFDGVVIGKIHENYVLKLQWLGLAFFLTNDSKYLEKSKEIIGLYAVYYPKYAIHDIYYKDFWKQKKSRGKIGSTYLDEAIWIVKFSTAISFVWNNLNSIERKIIRTKILFPAESLINQPEEFITNRTCWQYCALGMISILTNNCNKLQSYWGVKGLMLDVLDTGFVNGFWYENCVGYHFFALNPIMRFTHAYYLNESSNSKTIINFSNNFRVLNSMIRPDGLVSAINDANPFDISILNANFTPGLFYFANNLDKNGEHFYPKQLLRDSSINLEKDFFKFLFYENTTFNLVEPKFAGINSYGGMDFWKKGGFWLAVKTDKKIGVHSHPDRLSFQLFYNNINLTEDLGILMAYGSELHENWFKTAQSHNSFDLGTFFMGENAPKMQYVKRNSSELKIRYTYYHPNRALYLTRTFTLNDSFAEINDKVYNMSMPVTNNFSIHFTNPIKFVNAKIDGNIDVKNIDSNCLESLSGVIVNSDENKKFDFSIVSKRPVKLKVENRLDRNLNQILFIFGTNTKKSNTINYKIKPI